MPGVAPEIGLDQGLGDARGRGALDGVRETGHQELERGEIGVAEPGAAIGRPGGVGAVHQPDRAFRAKAVDHRDIVGHPALPQLLEHRELHRLVAEAAAEGRLPGLVQPMERTLQPLVRAAVGIEPAVLRFGRAAGVALPLEDATLQHRMQRVDSDHRAAERQSDGDHALAEALQQVQLAPTRQAGGGDPLEQWRKTRVVHGRDFAGWWPAGGVAARPLMPERPARLKRARTGGQNRSSSTLRFLRRMPDVSLLSRRASYGIRRRGGHGRAGARGPYRRAGSGASGATDSAA